MRPPQIFSRIEKQARSIIHVTCNHVLPPFFSWNFPVSTIRAQLCLWCITVPIRKFKKIVTGTMTSPETAGLTVMVKFGAGENISKIEVLKCWKIFGAY